MATASNPMTKTIIKRLGDAHPVIRESTKDGEREIIGDERDETIARWAHNAMEGAFAEIRVKRNALLAASDWTQAADAPVDAKAWAAYRQALRDLPATIKDPTAEVVWPEPPK